MNGNAAGRTPRRGGNMELTQLRYFYEVYNNKNICAAAERLNVTQQAVSRQLQKLEEELGVTLFARGPRGVKATVYADQLAERVAHMLPALDAFVYDIRSKDTEPAGVVRLGIQCWQMSKHHVLRYDVLHDFEKAYPRIRLIWENSTPPRCREGLAAKELDLVVMGMPKDPSGLELTPLRSSRWFMLMAKDHPLAGKKELKTGDLAGQRIILADDEAESRARIRRELAGMEEPVFIGVKDFVFDLIGQQVEGERALMLTTGTVLEMFNPERFAMVPLEAGAVETQLYLVRLAGNVHSPAERVLHQYLIDNWSK